MNLLTVLDAYAELPEAAAQRKAHEAEARKRIASLEQRAEDLREEANELDEEAGEIEAAINAPTTLPARAAGWMLTHLAVSPFVAARLEYAVRTGDVRVPMTVALLYGIALPAEFFPAVPARDRVARGSLEGLELFERGAA